MNEEEFDKHKETIENYIIEELILRVPDLINFTIHKLPVILEKDTEYIFFISENVKENEIAGLKRVIVSKLLECYDNLNLEYDFIIVFASY